MRTFQTSITGGNTVELVKEGPSETIPLETVNNDQKAAYLTSLMWAKAWETLDIKSIKGV